jgi:hypothetical protein
MEGGKSYSDRVIDQDTLPRANNCSLPSRSFRPKNIKTRASNDHWVEVTAFKLEGGRLRVTASNGETLILYGFSPYFRGNADKGGLSRSGKK